MAKRRQISVERLERIAADALLGGYGTVVPWSDRDPSDPLAGRGRRLVKLAGSSGKLACSMPLAFELFARYSATHGKRVSPITVIGEARCRKCDNCLKARSHMWRMKAVTEYAFWPVTAFGTFTMSPQHHYEFDARIEAGKKSADGSSWDRYPVRINQLSSEELFRKRVTVFGEELQLYMKRLRKGDAVRKRPKVRYLLVAEAHDGEFTAVEMRGRVHFHILVHEVEAGSLFLGDPKEALIAGSSGDWVRKRYQSGGVWRDGVFLTDDSFVRKNWHYGWTKFQFAENEKAASYLCKYLNKTATCRIRASQFYGDPERININAP